MTEDKKKFGELSGWHFPEGIEKEQSFLDFTNEQIIHFHDQMHIFWKKFEEGYYFGWNFIDIYKKHKEVVLEMLKRSITHIHPINELDLINPSFNEEEIKRAFRE